MYCELALDRTENGYLLSEILEDPDLPPCFRPADIARGFIPAAQLISGRRLEHLLRVQREDDFCIRLPDRSTFIIALAGSVAAGKSTLTRLLAVLLSHMEGRPRVETVSSDCFIYPAAELTKRGIMDRKGFPESYDWNALIHFMQEVRRGQKGLRLPVYSHEKYDILPDVHTEINAPDILIIEGINMLQTVPSSVRSCGGENIAMLADFSIYLDAAEDDLLNFFTGRIQSLADEGQGFYQSMHSLSREEVNERALDVWNRVNLPNLRDHIAPTRKNADMIFAIGHEHELSSVLLRW